MVSDGRPSALLVVSPIWHEVSQNGTLATGVDNSSKNFVTRWLPFVTIRDLPQIKTGRPGCAGDSRSPADKNRLPRMRGRFNGPSLCSSYLSDINWRSLKLKNQKLMTFLKILSSVNKTFCKLHLYIKVPISSSLLRETKQVRFPILLQLILFVIIHK